MRYSQIFSKTVKNPPADADSINAKLLTQGGFIYKQMAGVYVFLPLGLRVLNKIQNIIRQEMNALGANEILMPALTQEENYTLTGRDTAMADILFKTEGSGGAKLVLNPTHEEIITPLVQKYTFSYRDLPVALFQIQNKFRNEPRAKSGLLRGREFSMKDLYSFHTSEEDLSVYYDKVKEAYYKIYKRLGIGDITYITFASGGTFSRYSHEFQTVCPVGEDIIYVCEKCHVAVNKELIEEHNYCPQCQSVDLIEKKAIEVGNIFKQRTKFTSAFKFTYADKDGKEQPVEMAAYGIGPSRLMGAIVEIFNDSKGIIWPESIAPYQVHLISLGQDENVVKEANKIYQELLSKNIEVLFDDRSEASAGEKFSDADLIGLPWRLIVSKKTLEKNVIEIKKRSDEKSKLLPQNEALAMLS